MSAPHVNVALFVTCTLLVPVTGCDRRTPAPPVVTVPGATTAPQTADASPETPALPGDPSVVELESLDGSYLVRYRLDPPEIPLNELFSIEAWVYDLDDPSRPLEDVVLGVDGRMPDHRHGLNRAPTISRTDDGGYFIDGMLFHMPGFWELHFDVTRGAVTERAQLEVRLR